MGLTAGLHFDHDGDGFHEATGWVAPGAGMLMLDTNGDEALTNGTELFGDFTPVNGNLLAVNGFQALSQYDRNGDGRIDASDPIFSELRVWQHERDAQGNAIIVNPHLAGRFSSLSELGITAIELTSTIANQTDAAGNTLVRSGRFVRSDGTTAAVAEYRLVRNEGDTVAPGIEIDAANNSRHCVERLTFARCINRVMTFRHVTRPALAPSALTLAQEAA